ncbi:MAG: hypothetical protein AAF999_06795 [Pseudomonadota bacterium]
MERQFNTSYMAEVYRQAQDQGGLFNAHLHIDRAETLHATWDMMRDRGTGGESSLAIAQKHALIPTIHNSDCYDPQALEDRVQACVARMADLGTRHAHSVVDVTPDRVGTTAMERLLTIADRLQDRIDFQVGAYSPFGFPQDDDTGWKLIEKAAGKADFLGSLPERDDQVVYPDHIGFEASCRRILSLASELGKDLHIHVDQKNHDREDHTEQVIRIVRNEGFVHQGEVPRIWLIHVISPSAYDEARFEAMGQALAELNIGVICCPSAAISMRQLRPLAAPTHNSIARVLELLVAGVHVRLGTDNVCDITSPAGTLDVMDEIFVLSNAVRYYDPEVMGSLAAGRRVSRAARARIAAHLEEDARQCTLAQQEYAARSPE